MDVKTCKADDPLFQQLKRELYQDKRLPTVPEPSGPHLHSCYVVIENGRPLARAVLFNNTAQGGMKERCAQVGSFEAKDNQAAVDLLFKAVSQEAKKLGAKTLVGPMNGSTWHSYRFNDEVIEPFFTEFVHPPYYPAQWEAAGFEKLQAYYSAISEDIQNTRLKPLSAPEGLKIREINLEYYEQELGAIHEFCQEAFAGNFHFTPVSQHDFLSLYQPLKNHLNPQLILMAEINNTLAGIVLGLPNHYDLTGKSMIIKTLARKPGRAYAGVGNLLAHRIYNRAQNLGFHKIIHAFMLRSGKSTAVSGKLFGKPFREYSLYSKKV